MLALRLVLHLLVLNQLGHGALVLQVARHLKLEAFLLVLVVFHRVLGLQHNNQVGEVVQEEVHKVKCNLYSRECLDKDLRWVWLNHNSHRLSNHQPSSTQGHLVWKKLERDPRRLFLLEERVIAELLMPALAKRAESPIR